MNPAPLLSLYRSKGLRIATAESCTGGMIAAALTDVGGSSDVFERGFVTYSNAAKTEMLGVPAELIAKFGAVSEQVAREMAAGALRHAHADVAVAVTGIAGPGGGSPGKPIGLVYLAVSRKGSQTHCERLQLPGSRADIRRATVARALEMLAEILTEAEE